MARRHDNRINPPIGRLCIVADAKGRILFEQMPFIPFGEGENRNGKKKGDTGQGARQPSQAQLPGLRGRRPEDR